MRTVFLHELFPGREGVRDRELAPLVADTCPEEGARAWYYALLDYGAHLKTQVANPSRRSAHHTRQSAFEGSRRQKRAELVRIVLAAPGIAAPELAGRLDAFEQDRRPPRAWMRTCSTASSPTWCPRASSAGRATYLSRRRTGPILATTSRSRPSHSKLLNR